MIDYHADDYGLFPGQSRRILDCYYDGVLTGVSVLTNSPFLEECMTMLRQTAADLQLTVHLNYYEGKALSPHEQVNLITDENNVFHVSFASLVLASYLPLRRRKYYPQVKAEIRCQVEALLPWLAGQKLRIDGHGHYHMIPIVFDALAELIEEENWNVEYIRLPYEDRAMYCRIRSELVGFQMINLVKVLIMNHFVRRNRRKYPEILSRSDWGFSGLMYSGNMRYENTSPILRELCKKKENVEILFHPGDVREPEDIEKITDANDKVFLTSEGRRREYEALHLLKEDAAPVPPMPEY